MNIGMFLSSSYHVPITVAGRRDKWGRKKLPFPSVMDFHVTNKMKHKVNMQLWNLRGAMKELWKHPSFHHFSSGWGEIFIYSVATSAPWDSSVWPGIIISWWWDYHHLMWPLCHEWGSQGPPGLVLAFWDSAAWPHNLPSCTRNVFLLSLYPLVHFPLIFLASIQAPLQPILNFSPEPWGICLLFPDISWHLF